MAVLPDVNVLLPLVYGAHTHHAAALAWLGSMQQDGQIILCRFNQLSLLRSLDNRVAMGLVVQSGSKVWKTWDALLADDRFCFCDEPAGFEAQLRDLTGAFVHQPKRWQDACLAAFAIAADIELVTFDTGFRNFPGLRHHIL